MQDLSDYDDIKLDEKNINNVRYADDTALIADSEEKLQTLVQSLVRASGERGLKLNVSKTKVMVISKQEGIVGTNIMVDGQVLEQVRKHKFLGSLVMQDRRCVKEVKTRKAIAIAMNPFN